MFNFSLYSYGKYLLKYKIKKILLESASKIGGIEREVKGFILILFALAFSACASKPVYKVEIKEVFIPVKCNLKLPKKPQENGSFESHRALSKYYLEIEQIAKDCTR